MDIKILGRCYIRRKIFHWLLDLDVRDPVGMCLLNIVSGPPCFNGTFAHYDTNPRIPGLFVSKAKDVERAVCSTTSRCH